MTDHAILRIDGEVEHPCSLSLAELAAVDAKYQVADVSRLVPGRAGDAVTLEGLLTLMGVKPSGTYLTIHASADGFHASVPLAAVRASALVVYRLAGGPLPAKSGGPIRLLIPDTAACHTHEVDECANVKFVDHLEITRERGHDNRPATEAEHARLHGREP